MKRTFEYAAPPLLPRLRARDVQPECESFADQHRCRTAEAGLALKIKHLRSVSCGGAACLLRHLSANSLHQQRLLLGPPLTDLNLPYCEQYTDLRPQHSREAISCERSCRCTLRCPDVPQVYDPPEQLIGHVLAQKSVRVTKKRFPACSSSLQVNLPLTGPQVEGSSFLRRRRRGLGSGLREAVEILAQLPKLPAALLLHQPKAPRSEACLGPAPPPTNVSKST
mmetsp:Transcript_169810/g.545021  ORF Transcript_169810/g.545021 Transcript_169810/m.545021 type:complete len:224 (-) Transcript_169810:820-1491(-)